MSGFIPYSPDAVWEDVTALWILRGRFIDAARVRQDNIIAIDRRLHGLLNLLHLDWSVMCREPADSASIFASTYVIVLGQKEPIPQLLAWAVVDRQAVALGIAWAGTPYAENLLDALLQINSLAALRLAVELASVLRRDVGSMLETLLKLSDATISDCAARLAAECGRTDALPLLYDKYQHASGPTRFWAAWSIAVMDERRSDWLWNEVSANKALFPFASPVLAARALEASVGNHLNSLATVFDTSAPLAGFCGVAGYRRYVPWLFSLLDDVAGGPAAAEAIAEISGAPIEQMAPHPNCEVVDLARPWPDKNVLQQWWQTNETNLHAGQRYFRGAPLSDAQLMAIWEQGAQRDRGRAAIELAIRLPSRGIPSHVKPRWQI